MEDIANSKQVSVFEQRKELLTLLRNDLYDEFKSLVSSLLGDYVYLYRSTKGRTKYADFQVEWLQHIRAAGETGQCLLPVMLSQHCEMQSKLRNFHHT